eukprot:PhF_6_TR41296/c9_g1_i1/m.62512
MNNRRISFAFIIFIVLVQFHEYSSVRKTHSDLRYHPNKSLEQCMAIGPPSTVDHTCWLNSSDFVPWVVPGCHRDTCVCVELQEPIPLEREGKGITNNPRGTRVCRIRGPVVLYKEELYACVAEDKVHVTNWGLRSEVPVTIRKLAFCDNPQKSFPDVQKWRTSSTAVFLHRDQPLHEVALWEEMFSAFVSLHVHFNRSEIDQHLLTGEVLVYEQHLKDKPYLHERDADALSLLGRGGRITYSRADITNEEAVLYTGDVVITPDVFFPLMIWEDPVHNANQFGRRCLKSFLTRYIQGMKCKFHSPVNNVASPRIVIIDRVGTRRILNIDVLQRSLQTAFHGVHVEVVLFENRTTLDHVAVMQRATYALVAMHGAALVNVMFLPQTSVVLEFMPYQFWNGMYREMCERFVIPYASVRVDDERNTRPREDIWNKHCHSERKRNLSKYRCRSYQLGQDSVVNVNEVIRSIRGMKTCQPGYVSFGMPSCRSWVHDALGASIGFGL